MCGRFASMTSPEAMRRIFGTKNATPDFLPRYNLAPTQDMLVVRYNSESGERCLDIVKWGLIPSWAADPRVGAKLINARAETVADKPSFRDSFNRRRCLIPADAFYEWRQGGRPKQPYAITRKHGGLLVFAGLWSNWRDPAGQWIRTAVVITTTANDVISVLHDRMPAVLGEKDWATWLGETPAPPDELQSLLKPLPSHEIEIYPVGTGVNRTANDGPWLLERLAV